MKKVNPISKYFLKLFSMFKTNIRDYGMYIALAVIFTIFAIVSNGVFLKPMNFSNLLNQTAYISVLAVGMTLVIVTRQIDLSVGYLGAFLGAYVVVAVEETGNPIWLGILVALIITMIVGALKGYLIAKIKVPSFVVTLAGMFLFKGLLMLRTSSRTIPATNNFFRQIGSGYLTSPKIAGFDLLSLILGASLIVLLVVLGINKRKKNRKLGIKNEYILLYITKFVFLLGVVVYLTYTLSSFRGISYQFLITLIVVGIYHFFTTQTVMGRQIYAVGGNPEAAELSGISVEKIIIVAFISMGILSLVSGVMYVSYTSSASANHGPFWELYAIAAAYIGGTSANGGVGKVVNAVIGSIVIVSLKNGMSLLGVGSNIEPIFLGTVLLLAVLFDIYTRNIRGVDLIGVHYAKIEHKNEYRKLKEEYINTKNILRLARKENAANVIDLEYQFTSAQGEFNRLKEKIRVAKEDDYLEKIQK